MNLHFRIQGMFYDNLSLMISFKSSQQKMENKIPHENNQPPAVVTENQQYNNDRIILNMLLKSQVDADVLEDDFISRCPTLIKKAVNDKSLEFRESIKLKGIINGERNRREEIERRKNAEEIYRLYTLQGKLFTKIIQESEERHKKNIQQIQRGRQQFQKAINESQKKTINVAKKQIIPIQEHKKKQPSSKMGGFLSNIKKIFAPSPSLSLQQQEISLISIIRNEGQQQSIFSQLSQQQKIVNSSCSTSLYKQQTADVSSKYQGSKSNAKKYKTSNNDVSTQIQKTLKNQLPIRGPKQT